ncbi:hypothetical protein NV377_18575 [Paenibacillus sp. T3-5-0-4]|nr:hypothetical protein [Paenibacillus endoradicis]
MMSQTNDLEEKIDMIITSMDAMNDTIVCTMSRCEERLKAIEKLMWKIERKLIEQDKILDLLTRNELIDQLVKREINIDRIKPLHLQSEIYRKQTAEAMMDEDD